MKDDIFGDIPTLDLSELTKDKKADPAISTGGTGRFSFDEELEPLKVEKTPEQIETEKTNTTSTEAEDTNTDTTGDGSDENTTEESPTKLISSFLKEKGIINYTDEEFKDEDDFIAEQVSKQITNGVQSYKETLPEEIKALIENYEEGVPLGQLLEYEKKTFELSSITSDKIKEDSRLQEDLVESFLLNTGWTKEETDERIKELQDAGIMEKWAIQSHNKLLQMEKARKEELIKETLATKKAEENRYKTQLTQLQNTLKEKKEFFEGIPTNDIEKKAVFDAVTKYDNNGRNKISQYLNNPELYLKTAYFLEVLKGDLSKLKTVAKTTVIKDQLKKIDGVKPDSAFKGKNLKVLDNFLKTKQSFLK